MPQKKKVVIIPISLIATPDFLRSGFTSKTFEEVERLVRENVEVYFLGQITPTLQDKIYKKHATIPGSLKLSNTRSSTSLLKELLKEIQLKHKGITKGDVALFSKPPKQEYTQFSTLNKVISTIQNWSVSEPDDHQALRSTAERAEACLVVNFQPKSNGPRILRKLTDMGWVGQKSHQKITSPTQKVVTTFSEMRFSPPRTNGRLQSSPPRRKSGATDERKEQSCSQRVVRRKLVF